MDAARLSQRIGAIIGAILLLDSAASAQPATTTTNGKPKPATTAKRAAPAAPRNANSDYWSINYAAPTRYDSGRATTATRRETTELTGELGRVPLQSGQGTIGFDTQSRLNPNVPGGADPYTRKESSFVGLSINVPSESKNIALPVLPTPWSRPE